MIKFTPHKRQTTGNLLKDPENNLYNIANHNLSVKMNEALQGKCCEKHPDIDSVISVRLIDGDPTIGTVENYCCKEFKEQILDLIAQNKNPYSARLKE